MTTALVTGATGMLGSDLADLLLTKGIRVRAFARAGSDTTRLERAGVTIFRDDIDNAVAGVDWLFHAAGHLTVSAPFGAGADEPAYRQTNVDLTQRLLTAAKGAGVARFLYVSSSSVYDIDAPIPIDEQASCRPVSAYGRSKVAAEAVVGAAQAAGLATTIIRPVVIYGPRDRYFTPTALNLARLPLLPLVDGGRRLFDLIYVRDVSCLLLRAASVPTAAGRVYNAAPAAPTSLADLVAAYTSLTGRGPRLLAATPALVRLTAPLVRPWLSRLAPGAEASLTPAGIELMRRDLRLDMGRAQAELDFTPTYDLRHGLAATLPHFGIALRPSASIPAVTDSC